MITNPKSKTRSINPNTSLYILTFEQCNAATQPRVGSKNAGLGVVEGPARVVMRVSDLSVIQPGEILVCPTL